MVKSEFKKVTKEWLLSKDFKKTKDIEYVYPLEKFDICVMFYKGRFSELYGIEVGFQLKDGPREIDWANMEVEIPNEKYWKHLTMADGSTRVVKTNFYYEEWDKEEYLQALEEIHKNYIQPYFDHGIEHVKKIAQQVWANPEAIAKVLKM